MEEKTRKRLKKLQALAERGVGGEKETAQRKLEQLLKANGITLDDLEAEKKSYYLFSYNGAHKKKLLKQCIYKVMGYADHTAFYRSADRRQKIGIDCTAAQKIEIELEYEFYSRVFDEELSDFMNAFINKQSIYPEDAPHKTIDEAELTPEELAQWAKQQAYEDGITKRTRAKMIEQK